MRTPIRVPTLHLHGALDGCTLPRSAQGSGRYVEAAYRWRLIEGAGHYPHQERPQAFDAQVLGWLGDPEPEH
jgi:pimeloyl-ACP methyl ester carboxylesterase